MFRHCGGRIHPPLYIGLWRTFTFPVTLFVKTVQCLGPLFRIIEPVLRLFQILFGIFVILGAIGAALNINIKWNETKLLTGDFGSPDKIPHPLSAPDLCGSLDNTPSKICDPYGYFSSKDRNELIAMMTDSYVGQYGMPAQKNAEYAILIIKKMSSSHVGKNTIEIASEKFARGVHDVWGVGGKVTNDGVLIFLSIDDRSVFISTGSGVMNYLHSYTLSHIINDMRPLLKSRSYFYAVRLCLQEMEQSFAYNKDSFLPFWLFHYIRNIFMLFLFIFGVIGSVFMYLYTDGYINSKEQDFYRELQQASVDLGRFMTEVSDADEERQIFRSNSCPICLDDFSPTTNQTSEKDNLVPMAISCGHVFCRGCLTSHLRSSSINGRDQKVCPICRADIVSTSSTSLSSSLQLGVTSISTSPMRRSRIPELQFRLNRIRLRYPYLRLNHHIGSLARQQFSELRCSIENTRSTIGTTISTRQTAVRMQSHSSSSSIGGRSRSSFGGGRSFGGFGGRW